MVAAETTPAAWTQRLVPVPVWALIMIGAAMAGGGGILGMQSAEAKGNAPIDAAQIEQILSSQRRIEGRLDAIERQTATVAAMAHTHTGGANAQP
jgi:hypothetical protein